MDILIRLSSKFYNEEQDQYCGSNMIKMSWSLPFLPRPNDLFDCDSIIDEMPEFDTGLAWNVDYVVYEKISGEITPILWLIGE